MSASPSARKTFVDSVVAFLEKYDFDGLDLNWEYPTWEVSEYTKDRENFSAVVRELRQAFNRVGKGYLLTAGVTPNTKSIGVAYEVSEIARDLDFINVMCFDYQGLYDVNDYTSHNSPLYKHPADVNSDLFFNVNDTVIYWLQAGLPKEKLILGMALHGRGFTLAKSKDHGLFAPSSGRIYSAPYSGHAGIWGYNEICETFQEFGDDWKISINEHVKAPYAFNWHNWIGYEDVESIYYKAEYARKMDLGGAMVWSLDSDDFKGKCHDEPYILSKTIVRTLNGGALPKIPKRPQVVPEDDRGPIIIKPSAPRPTPKLPSVDDIPTRVCTVEAVPAGNSSLSAFL